MIEDVEVKLKDSDILGNPYSKTSHLSSDQEEDVLKLLQDISDLFTNTPRVTTLVKHDVVSSWINTCETNPIQNASSEISNTED